MSNLCALCIGDLHLDTKIWGRFPAIAEDACYGFVQCLALAIEQRVPLMLAGDIFDVQRPPAVVLSWFREAMDLCEQHGIPVYTIQGNHDKQSMIDVPIAQAIHRHPVSLHQRYIDIGPYRWFGLDYAPLDTISEQLLQLSNHEPIDILVLHQAVKQYLPFDGAWNCDLDVIPDGVVRCIILGDIHDPVRVEHRIPAYYTGSTHPRDVQQIHRHSCIGVVADGHGTIERIPLRRRAMWAGTCEHDVMVAPIMEQVRAEQQQNAAPLAPLVWIKAPQAVYEPVLHAALQWCAEHGIEVVSPSAMPAQAWYRWSSCWSLRASSTMPSYWYVVVEPVCGAVEQTPVSSWSSAHEPLSMERALEEFLPPDQDAYAYRMACTLAQASLIDDASALQSTLASLRTEFKRLVAASPDVSAS